jgi:hypothetical protein
MTGMFRQREWYAEKRAGDSVGSMIKAV